MFFALVFSTFVLGFFDVRRFCDDAKEASLKIPSRPTAAIEAGARGLAERVSSRINAYQQGPSDRACFSRTCASPPAAAAGCTVCLELISAAADACMTCMVRTVLTIHVRQAQVHLPTLPVSATKASLANLLLHHHPSGATQNISNVPEIQKNTKKVAQTESGTVEMKIQSQDGPRFKRSNLIGRS